MRQYNDIRLPKGFTLIELLVVVAVLGILSGGILIALNITGTIGKASLTKAKKFAAQLERGLAISQVGKWSFEGNANDTSGYGNNGTLEGGASLTSNCKELGFGQCVTLDGVVNYVQIADNTILRLGTEQTIAVWVNVTSLGTGLDRLVGKGNSLFTQNYSLLLQSDGDLIYRITSTSIQCTIWNDGGGKANIKAGSGWHHVVGTRQGTTMKLYLDGTERVSGTCSITPPMSPDPITIGYDAMLGTEYFNGLIDEVSIYNQALTLSQIQYVYAQGWLRKELSLRF